MTTQPVRSVAEIDTEIVDVKAKRESFETRREPDKVKASAAHERRREAVIAATIDGDAKAAKRLEGLTLRSDAAARAVRDNEDCIEELGKRIGLLNGERRVSVRDELQAARASAAAEQLKLSAELDRDVAALVEQCGAWLELALIQYQLCSDLGEPISRTPAQQLGWVLNQAFGPLAPMMFEKSSLRGATFTMLAERFATDPAPAHEEEKAS